MEKKCQTHRLNHFSDGDRRLKCDYCDKLYVLYDGIPTEIVDKKGNPTFYKGEQ